jgi:hypothetical protein
MSKTATRETIKDDQPLFEGTHKGPTGTTLMDRGAMFRSLGVHPDLEQYVENVTQLTASRVESATDDEIRTGGPYFPISFPFTFSETISWDNGDTYRIYATSTKDSTLGSHWVDVSRGWKINEGDDITREGWRTEDIDLDDKGRKKVFGPGQPEK